MLGFWGLALQSSWVIYLYPILHRQLANFGSKNCSKMYLDEVHTHEDDLCIPGSKSLVIM